MLCLLGASKVCVRLSRLTNLRLEAKVKNKKQLIVKQPKKIGSIGVIR
jgi:hypothetical protein